MPSPRTLATKPPEGFADFVLARSPALLRAAWLLTGDPDRAEDLLQTALAKAWLRWSVDAVADSPEAYVRRILYTTYVSWWRRRWRAEVPAATLKEQVAPGDVAGDLAMRDAVRRALGQLSRQQRAVVVLRYVEDLSIERTAEVLGCSPSTVKVQSFRALATLRADPQLRGISTMEVES